MNDSNSKDGKHHTENPFGLLLEEAEEGESHWEHFEETSTELQSLENSDKRTSKNNRSLIQSGSAVLYDLQGKIVSKAVLRNLSPGGAGLEVQIFNLPAGSHAMVEFGGPGAKIGPLKCAIQWVAPLEKHPRNHKMIGIQFLSLTSHAKQSLEKYFENIKKASGFWA